MQIRRAPFGEQACRCLFQEFYELLEVDVAVGEEYRIVRAIELLGKPQGILGLEGSHLFGSAQDIMSERTPLEEKILEFIVYQFGWRVIVTLYLIADYLHLLVYFRLRIDGVEDDVAEQIYGSCDVLLENGGVIHRALLVGVSIEVASHALQTVEDVPGLATLGALEGDVLAEVSQSLLARHLVSGASVNLIAAVHHLAIRW